MCSFGGQGGDVQKGWVPGEFSGKLSIFLTYGTAHIREYSTHFKFLSKCWNEKHFPNICIEHPTGKYFMQDTLKIWKKIFKDGNT